MWNGSAFEALLTANWGTYKLAATEQSTTRYYYANMPAGINTAGLYDVDFFLQAGGSPAVTDTLIGQATIDWSGTVDLGVNAAPDAILTRSLGAESYAADGSVPTLAQMQFMLWSALSEFAISSTTITCKKLDGSTTAMTFTLNDATSPTSRTRAT